MLVLGWHGKWAGWQSKQPLKSNWHPPIGHDASAVLLRDGQIVAAAEEERFTRVKHSLSFPRSSILHCLREGGVSIGDLDIIATDIGLPYLENQLVSETMQDPRLPLQSGHDWVATLFLNAFQCDISQKCLHFCDHHLAHIQAGLYFSDFPEALCLCLDGAGDDKSGIIGYYNGQKVSVLRHLSYDQSLGFHYLRAIAHLGYGLFDEYKVMGLAPYGNPERYEPIFDEVCQLLPEGNFRILSQRERASRFNDQLAFTPRRSGEPFTQEHKDFAAALQQSLEKVTLHLLRHFQGQADARNLCFSGGVAHNCSLAGKVLKADLFEQLSISPVAHDGGNSLGAALSAVSSAALPLCKPSLRHVYSGQDIGASDDQHASITRWGELLEVREVTLETVSRLISDGAVIGWVQGRSEFGPRALGNRSIIADPRPAKNKIRINKMIKKREAYRPFAPSVLEEHVWRFFEMPETRTSFAFMNSVLMVRSEFRSELGAITHADGSARVQTISRLHNPLYYDLIECFNAQTGIPMLLNTSFNNDVEPIVNSVDDAIACFLTTGLDYLVVGSWLVRRTDLSLSTSEYLKLRPMLSPHWKLIEAFCDGQHQFYVEFDITHPTNRSTYSISRDMFRIISSSSSELSADEISRTMNIEVTQSLADELFHLWDRRAITLSPDR